MTITLPVQPLPLSRCFINVARNGRADSADYKAWKSEADAHLCKFHPYALGYPKHPKLSGPVMVTIAVKRPDRRRRDLDNLSKSALDLLVRNYVIGDDSDIVDLRIRWDDEIAHATAIEIVSAS